MQHAANSFHVSHGHGSSLVVKPAWIRQLQQHHHSGSTSYLQQEESQVKFVTNIKTCVKCFLFQVHITEDSLLEASLNKIQSLITTTTINSSLTTLAASQE